MLNQSDGKCCCKCGIFSRMTVIEKMVDVDGSVFEMQKCLVIAVFQEKAVSGILFHLLEDVLRKIT